MIEGKVVFGNPSASILWNGEVADGVTRIDGGSMSASHINLGAWPPIEYSALPRTLTNADIDKIVDRVLDRFPEIIKRLNGDENEGD